MGIEIKLNRNFHNNLSLESFEEGDLLDFGEESKELIVSIINGTGLQTIKYFEEKIYASGYLVSSRQFVDLKKPTVLEVRKYQKEYSRYRNKLMKADFF